MDSDKQLEILLTSLDKAQKQVILNLNGKTLLDWPELAAREIILLRAKLDKLNGQPTRKCGVTFLPGQGRCADT